MIGMAASRVVEQALDAYVRELAADEQRVLNRVRQRGVKQNRRGAVT
jgi:hypothetical protein